MKQSRLPGMGDDGPVDCLGMTFENDDARREHFLGRLKEHLADPEFRKQPGFPKGTDDAILQMSDPPYYTACPNPFLREFVAHHGSQYDDKDANDDYRRVPFSADSSVGKTHALYGAHGYHTKVPHLAIAPYALHYSRPGDVILDGFAGSGMTGVGVSFAAGRGPLKDRQLVEQHLTQNGAMSPNWGNRNVVLNDLSPAATFIAAGYNLPYDHERFTEAAKSLLDEVEKECGWMYETSHSDGRAGKIEYTIWSEVFTCPTCSGQIVFLDAALDPETKRTRDKILCTHCNAELVKGKGATKAGSNNLLRLKETVLDPATKKPWKRIKIVAWRIVYKVANDKTRHEKVLDDNDRAILKRIDESQWPTEVPTNKFPIEEMYHGSRLEPKGFTHIHHLFLPRAARALAAAWRIANAESDHSTRRMLLWFVEQAIWTSSVLNRYRPTGFSQVNQQLTGVYYVASSTAEPSLRYTLGGKINRLKKVLDENPRNSRACVISTGDCSSMPLDDDSIDYIFTDPPFGANIFYADLNILVESWHGVTTSAEEETIVDEKKDKDTGDYQDLMTACFAEYHRVLKPGRWMTIVFSNSHASVWNAVQAAILRSGFAIADTALLDKKQGTFKQVTSSAVKEDILITCYKPKIALSEVVGTADLETMWAIVSEHIASQPVWLGSKSVFSINIERMTDRLFDRMVAIHLVRGHRLPIDKNTFTNDLVNRFVEREGMWFVPSQVPEFERHILSVDRSAGILPVFVDRKTAISWLRYTLASTPMTLQTLRPRYFEAAGSWSDKVEKVPELTDLLQDHFVEGENGRWKVPDPKKEAELERARKTRNLKRFYELVASKGRIKEVHADVILVGFAKCFEDNDLETYSSIRNRLPAAVLDDEQVSMYKMMLDGRLDD